MYQTGGTIREIIDLVQRHEYVLPAIQREFVWKPSQIERLFDSLMQGFPFGTFLLWRVEEENVGKYRFYDFVRNYHEKDSPHCPPLPDQTKRVTAVLDGQQRLTALNIGLCGSHAKRKHNGRWKNPASFPTRHLYLDLLATGGKDQEGDGAKYDFRFLDKKQVENANAEETCWFKVGDILALKSGPPMLEWLNDRLPQHQTYAAFTILDQLHKVIHNKPLVAYYEEKSQDLTTVLNIFIRMNSGGTILSYSDLLLSSAVAQWTKLDARKEIHGLVDELNNTGEGFKFSQDLVLKAGLLLTDIGSVGFKVENFNQENMAILEQQWPDVQRALRLTVQLLASFGFNNKNLRAASGVLPIAYYLRRLDPGEKYLTTAKHAVDREAVRTWLVKSMLKASGIWGSGLDTLLSALRDTIRAHGEVTFPTRELETVMAEKGKTLSFEDVELDNLMNLTYGKAQTFALLSLLFPFIDFRNNFHVDHVFPRARFGKNKLRKLGLSPDEVERFQEMRDGLANLQLLDGAANIEKSQKLPAVWLERQYPDPVKRAHHCDQHLLGIVPTDMVDFPAFFERRQALLRARIATLVGLT